MDFGDVTVAESYLMGLRDGVSEGASVGRYDREVAISEARSVGYSAGVAWSKRPAASGDLIDAMWLGAAAALIGVLAGVTLRAWLDERDSARHPTGPAESVELAGVASGELPAGELDAPQHEQEEP